MSPAALSDIKVPAPGFPEDFGQLTETEMLYSGAVRAVCTRLENLNQEFRSRQRRSPIQGITHRLKTPQSIREKMLRRGLPLEYEVMRDQITDIGGVRVICSYIEDIYELSAMLKRQEDILLINEKDYIRRPKPNGYRSYHLILGVPIFLSEEKVFIPVEVQMRTIAMEFWASLEHQLRYKNHSEIPEELRRRLTSIADIIFREDQEMQQLFTEISRIPDTKQ